jgi:hypothetical protein
MTTNNIKDLKSFKIDDEKEIHRLCIYTLFLNPKGKVITDAFIIRPKVYEKNRLDFRT